MTTFEKAKQVIAKTLPDCRGLSLPDAAGLILNDLLKNRIMPTTMRASSDMFTRWHAHCRFLGTETGYGYSYWYNLAVSHAIEQDAWPVKVIPQKVVIDGADVMVDVQVPQSTTKATNKQLLVAYEVIQDGAKEHGITLPEHGEDE